MSRVDKFHPESAVESFEEYWSSLGKEYHALKVHCDGIASVMPAPHLKSLTDFSLVSIVNCKQYRIMESLSS